MKFYDIEIVHMPFAEFRVTEYDKSADWPVKCEWAKYDDVQKMRARLLVKLLSSKARAQDQINDGFEAVGLIDWDSYEAARKYRIWGRRIEGKYL